MAFQRYGQHDHSFIADTVEDLAKLPRVNMGSTCWVIATAEKYMINSQGEWILQTVSTNTQTPGAGEGTTPPDVDLSDYATIAYSDEQDRLLKVYSDEQDELTLQLADEHVAQAIGEDGELRDAVVNTIIETIEEEKLATWDTIPSF